MTSNDAILRRIATRSRPRRAFEQGSGSLIDLERSILLNLQRLFACRAGAAPALPDYGLPFLDHNEDGFAEAVRRFCDQLSRTIARYEPRVTDVRVAPRRLDPGAVDSDPLHLTLEIKARIAAAGARHRTRLFARFSPDGRCALEQAS